MGPFGPQLYQNGALELRIILDRPLGPKNEQQHAIFLRVGGMRRSHLNPPRYVCTGNGVLGIRVTVSAKIPYRYL